MTDNPHLPHKLCLDERKNLSMTGVTEVISFDENNAILQTSLGILSVHGSDLKLKTLSLDGGQVMIHGSITAMIYEQNKERSLGRRLFG